MVEIQYFLELYTFRNNIGPTTKWNAVLMIELLEKVVAYYIKCIMITYLTVYANLNQLRRCTYQRTQMSQKLN